MGEQKKNIWADFRPKRRKPLHDSPFAGVVALALVGAVGFGLGVLVVLRYAVEGETNEMRSLILGAGVTGAMFAIGLGLPGLYFYHRRRPEEDEKEKEQE
jgi:hypothetical protein